YRPRAIVFYAGDNDIAVGKSAREVVRDYQKFVAQVEAALDETQIIFIAIKPSIRRCHLVEEMREANRLIREFSEGKPNLAYLGLYPALMGVARRPCPVVIVEEGVVLGDDGDQLRRDLVSPLLRARARSGSTQFTITHLITDKLCDPRPTRGE